MVRVAEEWLATCGGCKVTVLDLGEALHQTGRRTARKEKVDEGLVRRCVAAEIGRRLGAREVTETPEFIGLDEFSVSGRRLYHSAICNLW